MEFEIASYGAEALVLQRHATECWVQFVEAWHGSSESGLFSDDTSRHEHTVPDLVDRLLLLSVEFAIGI